MSQDIFVDYSVKPFEYEKGISDIKNNIVVLRDQSKNAGTLYAFMQGLFKSEQKLFVMIFCLKEEGTMTGKHFLRQVRDVFIFDGYYIITWRPEK
jgi:hypothetical protein